MSRQALQTWDDAQAWFNHKYYPNQPQIITLIEGGPGSSVQIHFLNGSFPLLGKTSTQTTANGTVIIGAQVAINTYFKDVTMLATVEHELGHVIGLVHTNCQGCFNDLMWGGAVSGWEPTYDLLTYPSTLDLYAVYRLASHTSTNHTITLPDNIKYEIFQGNGMYESALPVPEFPFNLLVTFSSCMSMLGLLLRVKERKQHRE